MKEESKNPKSRSTASKSTETSKKQTSTKCGEEKKVHAKSSKEGSQNKKMEK